jgi:hypothetical protein
MTRETRLILFDYKNWGAGDMAEVVKMPAWQV